MARRPQHHGRRPARPAARNQPRLEPLAAMPAERKPPVTYGKPFILLEDARKIALIYQGGSWVQYSRTIAECRSDCRVKELPQKINGMTRYEICSPIDSAS